MCLDPKELNKHIKIPKFRMPTMEDVTSKLGKVKMFTVLDAKDGFLQVKLDEESAKMTTFHTPLADTSGLECHSVYAVHPRSSRDMSMTSLETWRC